MSLTTTTDKRDLVNTVMQMPARQELVLRSQCGTMTVTAPTYAQLMDRMIKRAFAEGMDDIYHDLKRQYLARLQVNLERAFDLAALGILHTLEVR